MSKPELRFVFGTPPPLCEVVYPTVSYKIECDDDIAAAVATLYHIATFVMATQELSGPESDFQFKREGSVDWVLFVTTADIRKIMDSAEPGNVRRTVVDTLTRRLTEVL